MYIFPVMTCNVGHSELPAPVIDAKAQGEPNHERHKSELGVRNDQMLLTRLTHEA
jgi:hypothetical protein